MPLHKLIAAASLIASVLAPAVAHAHEHEHEHEHFERLLPAFAFAPGNPPEGRFEWRRAERWVPAHEVRAWMPEHCHRGAWGRVRCWGGFYAPRWVPAHLESVPERIWVPFTPPPGLAYPF